MSHSADLADRLPRTFQAMSAGLRRLHPGMQIYVSQAGRVVVDAAVGVARADEPLTSDHCMPWLSAGKPLTALAVLQRVERGELLLDEKVRDRIPEFGVNGKDAITLRHLLTHTAGIQPVPTGWPQESWEAILERICRAKLRHGAEAGQVAAYDPARSWFVLGELLQRIEGRPFETILREDLFEPLGMEHATWTWPVETNALMADLHACDGVECRPQKTSRRGAVASPGSSFCAPARDLGHFYEMLLNGGAVNGRRIVLPETIVEMTTRQREGAFDLTFQHVVDFGLGVLVDSNRYGAETVPYGFGRHCSPRTFGHGGSECAIAFADPEHGLVVTAAANGRPGEAAHQSRHRDICAAIYQDLGLR
jgi:CubicO group peptidase (beta-lactamase class C family)